MQKEIAAKPGVMAAQRKLLESDTFWSPSSTHK